MKAFTVYQPYAYAIVAGLKGYETRPRRTHIRGRVAVHAGKGNPQFVSMPVSIALPESAVLHYGAVLGTVISIHAPRTGSDPEEDYGLVYGGISIHAPRTGSDRYPHYWRRNQ